MKLVHLIATACVTFCLPTVVLAEDAPATNKQMSRSYDCHYQGEKKSDDMAAKITRDGDNFTWSDDVGESAPVTLLPDHNITFDYTYTAKEGSKVSGKMTFKVLDNGNLDGTYSDSFDSGKITCTERKE